METDTANFVASIGVTILLLAYFLQLAKLITSEGVLYLSLNFVGGAIAAVSSYFLNVTAFVVLEGTWSLMAFFLLLRMKPKSTLQISEEGPKHFFS